jgi:hypothetical protein
MEVGMTMQRNFLLLAAFSVAVAIPAWAQAPAAQPQTVPNFSGIWSHPFLPGFEPPPSGPGPVTNKSRRSDNGVSNWSELVGDYTNPILQPHAAEAVKKHGDVSKTGAIYPTPSNKCWPGGVPFVFWDFLVQIVQQPDRVTMIYRHGNEVRQVRLNDRHPAKVTPSWYGDSVGHYEGDALVIDTVGIKNGPYAMVDMYGTPHTEKLHVVERYRVLSSEDAKGSIERNAKENWRVPGGTDFNPNYTGKVLQLHFTVEDEGVFTTPWTATITYQPSGVEWQDLICAENRVEYHHGEQSTAADVPTALKPDF